MLWKRDQFCRFFPLPYYLKSSLEFLIILLRLHYLTFFPSYFILFILILYIHLKCFFLSLKPKAILSLDVLVFLFQRVCMGCRPQSEALCRTRQNIKTNSHQGSNARVTANRTRSRIQLREVGNICGRLQMLCLNLGGAFKTTFGRHSP